MRVKTILNQCYKFKSFVYDKVRFAREKGETFLEVVVVPRQNSKAICSQCAKPAALYDRLDKRRFEFIPLWGYRVFLRYHMRRVNCPDCGVRVEQVPQARGKHELTDTYMQFLAHWAKKLSWQEVAVSFRTSWDKVFQAVKYIVQWGLDHRDLSGITAIGVALVPPLCVVGIGLGIGERLAADVALIAVDAFGVAEGAFLLFLANLGGISLTACIVLIS